MMQFLPHAACAGTLLAGCTFLIDFKDIPQDTTLEAAADAEPSPADRSTNAGKVDAPSDARPYKDALNGLYCATQPMLVGYQGDRDDLVQCLGGLVASAKKCDGGNGCLRMMDPLPDQCDECAKKANGTYCGRDMVGWRPENANVRVQCDNGAAVGILKCALGCQSQGTTSFCK